MIKIKRQLVYSLEDTQKEADTVIEACREALNKTYPDYKYEPYDNTEAVDNYVEEQLRIQLQK